MRHPALAALLHQLFVLSLDDDVLLQRRSVLRLQLVQNPHAVRAHIPILYLREVDSCESAHFDLLQHRLRDLLVDFDVVKHEEVFMRDCALLVERQLEPILQVFSLHEGQEVVFFSFVLVLQEVDVAEHDQGGEILADREAVFAQPAE